MLNIPCHFNKEIYDMIDQFMGAKLVVNPLHVQDLMEAKTMFTFPLNDFKKMKIF